MKHMAATSSRALQRLSRMGSPVVRWILSGKSHSLMSRRLLLVSFTGRKTGRSYTTPVSYVRDGNELLIPGGGKWWKNLAGGPVRVRLQGSWVPVSPEVITETQGMSEVLGRMMARNSALPVFTGIGRGQEGQPNPEDLERERRRGFVVVRLHMQNQVRGAKVA
jgi:deazaflavin-dependent oxidoreductase (nitroreductase family)